MTVATVEQPVQAITQGVGRYPIGLPIDAPTIRWFAEIIAPGCDIGPDGSAVDKAMTIIVADIETTPGYENPGEHDLAYNLATRFAIPLGFMVGNVWPQGGYQGEPF